MMKKIVCDLGLDNNDTGIALMTSRSEANISDIIVWDEPQVATMVGDSVYFFGNFFATYTPGETPVGMQGENGVVMIGDLSNPSVSPKPFSLVANQPFRNSYSCSMSLSLAENMEDMLVDFEVKAKGTMKSVLLTPVTAKGLIHMFEEYLEIPHNKREKSLKPSDKVFLNESMVKCATSNCKKMTGLDVTDISEASFSDLGLMPGSSGIEYSHNGKISGLVEDMGNDLIVNVGRLMGKRSKISGIERERKYPAFLASISQSKFKISIITPEDICPIRRALTNWL